VFPCPFAGRIFYYRSKFRKRIHFCLKIAHSPHYFEKDEFGRSAPETDLPMVGNSFQKDVLEDVLGDVPRDGFDVLEDGRHVPEFSRPSDAGSRYYSLPKTLGLFLLSVVVVNKPLR